MSIDAGEHLPLINRVIGQMNIPAHERDEAFSEGLVAITLAANSYDSNKGPLANWLASNIRWSIRGWLNKQHGLNMPALDINHAIEDFRRVDNSMELKEAVALVQKHLTELEYAIVMAGAWGYTGQEIARKLNISPVEVSRARKRARQKLEELR